MQDQLALLTLARKSLISKNNTVSKISSLLLAPLRYKSRVRLQEPKNYIRSHRTYSTITRIRSARKQPYHRQSLGNTPTSN